MEIFSPQVNSVASNRWKTVDLEKNSSIQLSIKVYLLF